MKTPKIFSKISTQLLFGFAFIFFVTIFTFIVMLSSIHNIQESQEQVTTQTFPFLKETQTLSKNIFDYILFVEKLFYNSQESKIDSQESLQTIENKILLSLKNISSYNITTKEITKIESVVMDVFEKTALLKRTVSKHLLFYEQSLYQNKGLIYQSIQSSIKAIKNHRILNEDPITLEQNQILSKLIEQLSHLQIILSQHRRDLNDKDIQRIHLKYKSMLRKVVKNLTKLEHNQLQKNIAKKTKLMIFQAEDMHGFFSQAKRIATLLNEAEKLIEGCKASQQELNRHISSLLSNASRQVNLDVINIKSHIDSNIILLYIAFLGVFISSFTLVFWYIKPRILDRISLLSKQITLISSGNLEVKVPTKGADEISQMSQALKNFQLAIIQKNKAEKRALDRNIRYHSIFKNIADGLVTFDISGYIETVNPACQALFGFTKEELLQEHITKLIPKSIIKKRKMNQPGYFLKHQKLIDGINIEFLGQKKNGKTVPLEITVNLTEINGSSLFTAIVRDISARKKVENELKESKSFLKLIMDNNPDLIFVKDKNFRIVEANKAFLSLYPEEKKNHVIGYTTVENFSKKEAEVFLSEDKKAFEKGFSETIESIQMPSGVRKILHTKKIRFSNAQKNDFILAIGRDVTEREELISKLSESNAELEKFAYVASHDLQEPLRMIRNFTQLIHKSLYKSSDEEVKEYLNITFDSAVRMQDLISDLLEYSRLDSDSDIYEEVNIEDIINYVLEVLSDSIQHKKAQITFEKMPIIKCNPIRISRVFQNLIGNAIKYQKQNSKPKIDIYSDEDKYKWKFCVKDNGIGMKQDYCEQIFLPFKRLHSKEEFQGTGIGLSICRKIIESMGGKIWAKSKEGKGTSFYFTLPKSLSLKNKNNIKDKNDE